MLERDIELAENELRDLEEDSDQWNEVYSYITGMENEARYITECLKDFDLD